jgi:outer membrane lipopolysaccharide assembly protein LptE/RlpB
MTDCTSAVKKHRYVVHLLEVNVLKTHTSVLRTSVALEHRLINKVQFSTLQCIDTYSIQSKQYSLGVQRDGSDAAVCCIVQACNTAV